MDRMRTCHDVRSIVFNLWLIHACIHLHGVFIIVGRSGFRVMELIQSGFIYSWFAFTCEKQVQNRGAFFVFVFVFVGVAELQSNNH